MVKNSNPVVQIARRLPEVEQYSEERCSNQYQISLTLKDSCFLLKTSTSCFVKEKKVIGSYGCRMFKL